MSEPMNVLVEIWPIAADEAGIWLLSGQDALRPSLPVMADNEPHADVELELAGHDLLDRVKVLHSTSWRVDGPRIVVTYVAVIDPKGLVRTTWPEALPVSLELAQAVGQPPPAGVVTPPSPRYIDVLLHALRHLRFLIDTDAPNRDAMGQDMRGHLRELTPALATMYDSHGQATAA